MSTTVQSLMLKLALIVDPTIKSTGATFAAGTIGTVAGDAFAAQELLDVYNLGRKAMFVGAGQIMTPEQKALAFGSTIKNATITFTTSGADATAPKPSDFMKWVIVEDPTTGVAIVVLSDIFLPTIRAKLNPFYVQTTTSNKFLVEQGQNFYGFNDPAGAFANASTARLTYYGIADFTLSDVTGGATIETIPEDMIPYLLEVAVAIAAGQGLSEVTALATALLTQKKSS